jgi:serine/threonine-protein kinase
MGYRESVPTSGALLGDRYQLTDQVASGGMGEVWQATDTVLKRRVAVKLLHASHAGDAGFQERFRREAHAMAAFHHPGVAAVYDYGETGDGEDAYIVMAYVDGQPLHERIAEEGRLDPATTMSVIGQAAQALHAAHQAGIVHRDVKPANLIVRADGTVVLVDFGVARSAGSQTLTGVDEVVGTANYIAPEQVSKQATGPATDVYALGAVAYHCLAGHPPFLGESPVAVALHHLQDEPPPLPDDVPAAVGTFVTTAMAKNPANRFPTAAAMADAATAAAARTNVTDAPTVPIPVTEPAAEPVAASASRRRRRVALWTLLLLALTGLGVVLALALPGGPGSGPTNPPVSPHSDRIGSTNAVQPGGGGATPTSAPGSPRRSGRTSPTPGGGATTAPTGAATPPAPSGPVETGADTSPAG